MAGLIIIKLASSFHNIIIIMYNSMWIYVCPCLPNYNNKLRQIKSNDTKLNSCFQISLHDALTL